MPAPPPIHLRRPALFGGAGEPVPWERLWCPFGGVIALEGSDPLISDRGRLGFLLDRSEYANPECRFTHDLLSSRGALILCGAPGSGKSAEAWRLATLLAEREPDTALLTLRADHIGSDRALELQEHPTWKAAKKDSRKLVVIIDGFDQIRLASGLPVSVLAQALLGSDLSRVRMVITCRASDWNASAGEELLNLWSQTTAECVFEICPLRRTDAQLAVTSFGLDRPDAFLDQIAERNLEAHALWPLTLGGLLSAYKDSGSLPSTAHEIFESSITTMLSKGDGSPPPNQSRRLAERVAALSILCGRSGVGFGESIPPDLLSVESIRGDNKRAFETVPELLDRFEVDQGLVSELCKSPLFVPIRPPDTIAALRVFGFTHHSLAEFLTANYLKELSVRQLRQILTVKLDDVVHVPPQLCETATWLAAIKPEWFDFLLDHTPEILFRVDGSYLSDARKQRLAQRALQRTEEGNARVFNEVERLTPAFAFPGFAELLKTTFANPKAHPMSRRLALQITEECRLFELGGELWELLQRAEHEDLRHWIGSALHNVLENHPLSTQWIERLRTMADFEADEDDELKGYALSLLLKQETIEASELIPYLSPRKDGSLYGSYWGVLSYRLPERLACTDVVPFLDAADREDWGGDEMSSTRDLLAKIVSLAIQRIDDSGVRSKLVRLITTRARSYLSLPLGEVVHGELKDESDSEERRNLLRIVIDESDCVADEAYNIAEAIGCRRPALAYLLARLSEATPDRLPIWANLISYVASKDERERNLEQFLAAYEKFPALQDALPPLREGMNIHESLIELSEENRRKRDKREAERRDKRPKHPTRREMMDEEFDYYRAKGSGAWVGQSQRLLLDSSGVGLADHRFSIPSAEGWLSLTDAERTEVREMARAFLIEHDDPRRMEPGWKRTRGSTAGYLAIDLLFDPNEYVPDSELAESIAEKWIRAYFLEGWNVDDRKKAISAILYRLNAEKTLEIFLERLRQENLSNSNFQAGDPLERAWDDRLSVTLADFLTCEPSLEPQTCRTAFSILAERDPEKAKEVAKRWLSDLSTLPEGANTETQRARLFCAGMLTQGKLWERASSFFQPASLSEQIFLENGWCLRFSKALSLAEFETETVWQIYVLFSKIFGTVPRRRGSGAYQWGGRDYVRDFMRVLDYTIAKRSSAEEISRRKSMLPDDRRTVLAFTVADAQKELASEGWKAWNPLELLRMVQIRGAIFIRDQDDLTDFVLDRLAEFPIDWTGNVLPLWRDLEQPKATPRSHSEERVSLAIAKWLEEGAQTLIVNREAQKRETMRLRTDLRIQMSVANRELIVEIKKANNSDVRTNLQTQLVDDYLIKGNCSHGVYLVAFFGDKKSTLGGVTPKEDEKILAGLKKKLVGADDLRVETMVLDLTDRR